MSNTIFKNAKKLKKADLKEIVGGGTQFINPDLSQCGCSCSGAVTGLNSVLPTSLALRYILVTKCNGQSPFVSLT